MKANELRIGNIVRGKTDKIKLVITDGEDIDDVVEYGTYEPIPLTPEIMEKCGSGFSFAENFKIHIGLKHVNPTGIFIEQYSEGAEPLEHVKYLHQLQNLYFALTGEELEINLLG